MMKTRLLFTMVAAVSLPLMAQEVSDNAFAPTIQTKAYLEPFIPRPDQELEASVKLAALEKKFGRKPNIVILLVDDMGWGDPGCCGGGLLIGAPTPTIDKMASQGLWLLSTYAQPTCTPSRAALNTGRIPTRSGLTRPTLSGERPAVNPWAEEVTTAELLSDSGYRTCMSGKWHLGESQGSYPHQVGYDEYYGILSVISDFSQQLDKRLYPDLVLRPDRLAALQKLSEAAITKGVKGGPVEIAEKLEYLESLGQIDQKFTDYSEDFIRRSVKAGKPFYLYHSFGRLHNDTYPAKGYEGKSPAGFPYRDAVLEVDDICARLLKVLEETGQAGPKEQASTGHARFEWGLPQIVQRAGRHMATFGPYPRKDIGLRKPGS